MHPLTQSDEDYRAMGRRLYAHATRPLWPNRQQEYATVKAVCARQYGIDLSELDFDCIIAEMFGEGAEYEWPAP